MSSAQGIDSHLVQGQNGQQGQATAASPDETRILEQAKGLKKDKKTEHALALLRKGMDQFPTSKRILNEALMIYMADNRNDDALRLLNERAKNFPEETQKQIRVARLQIMLNLIEPLLEQGNAEKAFDYLRQMADAGYRGFHQLKHNPLYEPMRQHAGFDEVLKKISENTGLGRPPRDFTAALTNGDAYTLSARKDKVVIVDFWSTSCPPCIKELPNISAIYQANKDRGLEIISISLDDKKEKLDAFLATHPMPWYTVFSGKGWNDDAARLYEILSIPSLWLVDKKGVLRYFDVRGEDLTKAVEELLAE